MTRTRKVLLGVACLTTSLAFSSVGEAETQAEIFARANRAYYASDFRAALSAYGELVATGVDDPDVAYDVALTHARLGHLGEAVRWYEHSLRLRPGDEGAERGLTTAQAALGARRAQREGEAVVQTRPPLGEALVRSFSERFLAWTFLVLEALLFSALAALLFVRAGATRIGLAVASTLLALVTVAAGLGLGQRIGLFDEGRPAIIVRDAPLREGPDPRAPEHGTAREGQRARVVGKSGGYTHVIFPGHREGWAEERSVGEY